VSTASADSSGAGLHCVVVGAGIVGACCAWQLQRRGMQVTLIDSEAPGQSTSFGNAGCISKTSVFPFSYPGVIRKLPGWLLDPAGPVRIRWSQLPRVAPWLYRFWRAGGARRVNEIVAAQATLMAPVLQDFDTILAATGCEDLRVARGMILLYESEQGFAADAWKYRERDRLGLDWQRLTREELAAREPGVRLGEGVALFEPLWQHVTDPGGLTARIAQASLDLGAEWVQERVEKVVPAAGGLSLAMASGRSIRADRVVLATGVWSNRLLQPLGFRVPLLPKRGYHTMYAESPVRIQQPIMSASRHVLLTPMQKGLRIAGTAEFAMLDTPPDYRRARALVDNARHFMPALDGSGVTTWMGQRPMMSDSLPVLGPLPGLPQVLCAFGHGHYGLTQGPTTGRIIASLVAGEDPGIDLAPFAIRRF